MKLTARILARSFFVLLLASVLWGQPDAALFDDAVLQEIHLTVEPATWQSLRDNYAGNDYYGADFSWNGTALANIGIRSRGSGSRSPKKPNLLVKFNRNVKGQKLLGHSTIILKANNQDGSMLREFLTFQLLQRLGLPAPRESFARLYVNGEFFGLYTIVENPDEDYIERLYGESAGFLYEFNAAPSGYDFGYLGEATGPYAEMFEAKTHEDTPELEKIVAMIAAINQTPDADFEAVAQSYVDLQGLMSLLAVQNYMGDEDGILSDVYTTNNFYIYRAAAGKQFRFLPWDEDFTMIWPGRRVEQNLDRTVLSRRAYAVPELRQLYLDTIVQASSVAGGKDGWLRQEIERVYALIGPSARLDPNKQCLGSSMMIDCTADDFEREVNEVRAFAAERYENARAQIAALPSSGTAQMSEGGIVNAASNGHGLVPGSLVSIYGSSMARTGAAADATPLPRILADAEVKVNGVSAPLLFASPLQINFQVPWSTNVGDATVELSLAGVRKDQQRVEIQREAPGIFVATHVDFTPIHSGSPLKAGEIVVLFATGLGPVTVPVLDGQPASLDGLSWTTDPVAVTVNGEEVQILFSGLAPGMVGVYQLNVVMPAAWTNPGGVNLAIRMGQSDSPEVTLPRQ